MSGGWVLKMKLMLSQISTKLKLKLKLSLAIMRKELISAKKNKLGDHPRKGV